MRILIVGKNSYIGNNIEAWLKIKCPTYQIDKTSLKNDEWKEINISNYSVLIYVAGIVHQKRTLDESLYYKINSQLAVKIAEEAKNGGVQQFIFMSTMAVYGMDGVINDEGRITSETKCQPVTIYGMSKYEGEQRLAALKESNDRSFILTIIRAPMIYGPNCPGNYKLLRSVVLKSRMVPKIKNIRSMIYITNLCEFIRLIIENKKDGIFSPQNEDYISTDELMQCIAVYNNKKILKSKMLGMAIRKLGNKLTYTRKSFGNLYIDKKLSDNFDFKYCMTGFEESIKQTEINWAREEGC